MATIPSYGVIVVRCQVHELHAGHIELFSAVRARHNRVLVFVGVAPTGMTRLNPLDFETRKAMIQARFPNFTVLPLPDQKSDEYWSHLLDQKIGEVAQYGEITLYGGRDSFFPHYHGKHKPVELVLRSDLARHSGTSIRERLTNTIMESPDFRAGVIYAATNLRPRPIPCVDIAIMHNAGGGSFKVLLAQKSAEPRWRFVGGHAEAYSEDYEEDAKREVWEETGLAIDSLQYLGSARIDDWRWAGVPDKVKTILFVGWAHQLGATAQDDIVAVDWFPLDAVTESLIEPVHHPLLRLFEKYLEKEGLRRHGSLAPEPVAANG